MNYNFTHQTFPSANGMFNVQCYIYTPLSEPIGVVQLVHGMCEYTAKYNTLINFLTGKGFAVVGHDHIGHGNSIMTYDDLGFFAPSNGDKCLVADMHTTSRIAKELFPNMPHVVFAHSMGTFIARLFLSLFGNEVDSVILCGTAGPMKIVSAAIAESEIIIRRHGEKYRSERLNKLIFRNYNKRYGKYRTPFDWLSRDDNIVDEFLNDNRRTFIFTASAFRDLFVMMKAISEPEWFSSIPKSLPIFLIAGESDPVGQFGRGVKKVYNGLIAAGVSNTEIKLYPECRHELVNELNKDEVHEDVYKFIINSTFAHTFRL